MGCGTCSKSAFNSCDISARSGKEGMETGLASLLITLGDLLTKLVLLISMISGSADLKVLVPQGGMLLLSDTTMIPLNWKLRLSSCHFGLLTPLN